MAATVSLDMNKIINASRNISTRISEGLCATMVRTCLDAGGFRSWEGRPNYARAYVSFLPKKGYFYLKTLPTEPEAQWSFTKNEAIPGDIAVLKNPNDPTRGYADGHGNRIQAGHICIWNGDAWTSDFVQSEINIYRGRPLIDAHIFRYNGRTDNPIPNLSAYDITPGMRGIKGGGKYAPGSGVLMGGEGSYTGLGGVDFGGTGGARGSNFLGQKHMTNEELNKDMSNREELISFLRTTKDEIPDTPPPMVVTKTKSTLEHDSIIIKRMD